MNAWVHAANKQARGPETGLSAGQAPAERTQYLTFVLSGEMFAIGILAVKEIIEYGNLTKVPMMPACIRGVINLRGAVVPVMDLSSRFGTESTAVTKRTCIVIVETTGDGEHRDVGVVVDAVNEVLDIAASDIEPPPAFGARICSDFIAGIGKVNGRFVIVLNVDQVLAAEKMDALAALDAGAAAEAVPACEA